MKNEFKDLSKMDCSADSMLSTASNTDDKKLTIFKELVSASKEIQELLKQYFSDSDYDMDAYLSNTDAAFHLAIYNADALLKALESEV